MKTTTRKTKYINGINISQWKQKAKEREHRERKHIERESIEKAKHSEIQRERENTERAKTFFALTASLKPIQSA